MKIIRLIRGLALAGIASLGLLVARPGTLSAQILYVSNGAGTIGRIGPDGVSTQFATVLYGDGLAFDTQGNLYVTGYYNASIQEIAPSGAMSTFAAYTGGSEPQGLAFDTAGNLYVANVYTYDDNVQKISPSGVLTPFATLTSPEALAFDAAGNLYAATNTGTVIKFTPNGVGTIFASLSAGLRGLACDAAGNLYVANPHSNTIARITPAGVSSVFASAGLDGPQGLAFDQAGNLYAANPGNNTIEKFTPAGVGTLFASTGTYSPYFLAFDNVMLPIPEPRTWALLGVGFAGLGLAERRRLRQA